MIAIDFTDSQLPPEELEEVTNLYRAKRQAEQDRLNRKLANVRLRFGAEEYFKEGLRLPDVWLPLLEPGDL